MSQTKPTNYPALSTLVTVFFFWGFIAAGNSVFIPFCKSYFGLDQFQSQLIDFAFYLAYYLGALMLFVFGSLRGKDLVGHWGYKRSIVYGLLFSALGAATMIIAVEFGTFPGMLFGLFIVALGFSLQQTGAQPFAILLGDPKTGATRVNLGGAINSLGTTIGPVIIALALFGTAEAISDEQIKNLPLSKVVILYIFVGALFLGAAALFGFSKKVPDGKNPEEPEKAGSAVNGLLIITGLLILAFVPVFNSYRFDYTADGLACIENQRMLWLFGALAVIAIGLPLCNGLAQKNKKGWGAMQYPQLVYGMLAIFVYVGVEVAIGSNLGELLKQKEFGGYEASQIAPFIAMYWGGLMIGRWTGAIAAFDLKKSTQTLLKFVVPLIAFGIILAVVTLAGYDAKPLYWFILCVLVQILAAYITKDQPIKTLGLFGVLGIVAMLIGLFTEGKVAVYAFLSGGLACSIMWPCIFTLAIAGLGKYTTQGSAFLIMMILGGAIIPPIQGKLSDILGIQESFFIPVICFAYLAFYAWFAGRTLKNQGIDYEE